MATYKIKGQRYLRKYTENGTSPVYAASVQAQKIVDTLCEVPWTRTGVDSAQMTYHTEEIVDEDRKITGLEMNVDIRDKFDAALFCAGHHGGMHRAYANVAVYRYTMPDDALGETLVSLAARVTSDPYNSEGARLHVFTNSTGEIPMNCHVLRGENASGEIIDDGTTAAAVAKRTEKIVGKETYWYPTTETCSIRPVDPSTSTSNLNLEKYLFLVVALESYSTVRGNWLEGCSFIANSVEIETSAAIDGLSETDLNDLSGMMEVSIYSFDLDDGTLHVRAVSKKHKKIDEWTFPGFKAGGESSVKLPLDSLDGIDLEAWIGEGDFEPTMPFGCSNGHPAPTIELTLTSNVFARFNLKTWVNDRDHFFGKMSGNYYGLSEGYDETKTLGIDHCKTPENHISGGRFERVRIVRVLIDGYAPNDRIWEYRWNKLSSGTWNSTKTSHDPQKLFKVVFDEFLDIETVQKVVHEGFFLSDSVLGIDKDLMHDIPSDFDKIMKITSWSASSGAPSTDGTRAITVTNVTYGVYLGNGPIVLEPDNSQTWSAHETGINNLLYPGFCVAFDNTRKTPQDMSVENAEGRVGLMFCMDGYNSYTACRVQVAKGAETVVDTGIIRMPFFDTDQERYVYRLAQNLESGTYKFRVSAYNAKFTTDSWSGWCDFTI